MNKLSWSSIAYTPIPLALLMLLTRFHHFGSAVSLPDASLAVFFLAGLWFSSKRLLVTLLLEAALIDYIAITQFSVSDYCISPAYVFLIPTYSALWFAGQYAQKWHDFTSNGLMVQFLLLASATSVAFLISNGSFYAFSGKFDELSAIAYFSRVTQYFPPYISSTLIYSVSIIILVRLFSLIKPEKSVIDRPL